MAGMSTGVSPAASDLGLGDQLAGDLSEEEKKRRKAMAAQAQNTAMSPAAMSLLGTFGSAAGGR